MRKLLWVLFLGLPSLAHAEMRVENAWARASTGPNAALFMTLVNTSATPNALVQAQAEGCQHTELHNHIETQGIFRMVEVKTIEVPSTDKKELKPGGYHVMLMKLHHPLQKGDTVPLKLTFQDNQTLSVQVPVKIETSLCCCNNT